MTSPPQPRRLGRVPVKEEEKKELSRVLGITDPTELWLVVKENEKLKVEKLKKLKLLADKINTCR